MKKVMEMHQYWHRKKSLDRSEAGVNSQGNLQKINNNLDMSKINLLPQENLFTDWVE